MNELFNRASAVVQRYQGTVDKFTGDGLMALFGAPVALEDHALRACISALEIQSTTKRLATKVLRRDGVDLQLRVGLNSVLITPVRESLRHNEYRRTSDWGSSGRRFKSCQLDRRGVDLSKVRGGYRTMLTTPRLI